MKIVQWLLVFGLGLIVAGCGEKGEGPIVPPPPAPGEYADKHMPEGWWTDEAKAEEGRKLFIGETNPDVNCASCHGKDGKPVKAGARDFRTTERMKLYSDSVWFWRISEGVPNTKMKAWKTKLSEEDRWKLVLFERNFGLSGKGWDPARTAWVASAEVGKAPAAAAPAEAPAEGASAEKKEAAPAEAPAGGEPAASKTAAPAAGGK